MLNKLKQLVLTTIFASLILSTNCFASDIVGTVEVFKSTGSIISQIIENIDKIEKPKEVVKEVVVGTLNVRKENTTNSSVVGKIYWGNQIRVLQTTGQWDKIECDGTVGWVFNEYLGDIGATAKKIEEIKKEAEKVEQDEQDKVTTDVIKTVKITTDSLNIRKQPNTDSERIGSLRYNSQVPVYEEINGWYRIKSNGIEGYIFSEYTKSVDAIISRSGRGRETTSIGETIANEALTYVGYKYVYGAEAPSDGFDCSGLVYYLYQDYVPSIPRTAMPQAKVGTAVSKEDLVQGDLIFFGNYGSGVVEHVGIYIGDGMFVHAANSRRGVVTDTIMSGYYETNYLFARRVV